MVEEPVLEQELHEVGRRLWKALPSNARRPLKALDDKAMDYASRDAELKAALFRFVDVVQLSLQLPLVDHGADDTDTRSR